MHEPQRVREPQWFKGVWDGALNPCYTIADYNRIEGEVHGVVRRIAVWLFEDERFILAYDQRDMHRVGAALVARFRRDPRHLGRTRAAVARLAAEIERDLRTLDEGRVGSWPGARLAARADRLHGRFATLFGWTSMPEPCGLHLQARLAERCAARFGADAGPVYQARLMAPTFVSCARREAWARRRLAAALAGVRKRDWRLDRLPTPLAREVEFLVRTLDDLSRLQDERKRLALRTQGGLDAILREAARRAGEPLERLRAWLPEEVSAFLFDRKTGVLLEARPARQPWMLAVRNGAGRVAAPRRAWLAPAAAAAPKLPPPVVRRVARLALAAERRLGRPQDVEWVWTDDGIALVQARPLTA